MPSEGDGPYLPGEHLAPSPALPHPPPGCWERPDGPSWMTPEPMVQPQVSGAGQELWAGGSPREEHG